MQPQGSSLVNQEWFDRTIAEINAIDTCADLQRIVAAAFATLAAEVAAIMDQIAALLPLLNFPASLSAVISWIKAFATRLTGPYNTYLAQLAQLAVNIARLSAAATAAAGRLVNCAVSIPTIVTTPPSLPGPTNPPTP